MTAKKTAWLIILALVVSMMPIAGAEQAILRDVSEVSTGWDVLGAPVSLPFGIAPTGFTRMMQTEGEIAGARNASRR